jgi:hypothetical protein
MLNFLYYWQKLMAQIRNLPDCGTGVLLKPRPRELMEMVLDKV